MRRCRCCGSGGGATKQKYKKKQLKSYKARVFLGRAGDLKVMRVYNSESNACQSFFFINNFFFSFVYLYGQSQGTHFLLCGVLCIFLPLRLIQFLCVRWHCGACHTFQFWFWVSYTELIEINYILLFFFVAVLDSLRYI